MTFSTDSFLVDDPPAVFEVGEAGAGNESINSGPFGFALGSNGGVAATPFAFGNPGNLIGAKTGAALEASPPASAYDTVTVKTTGVTFNLEFTLADNPTANFETDVENAAKILSTAMQNQITVNLQIGYGEVDGDPLTNGSAAANPNNGEYVNYSSLRDDLIAIAPSGDTNFNALLTGSSIGGQTQVVVWNAELKALGLMSADDATTNDGSAGFATDISDASMVGVALHEMTHAMGRVPYGPGPDVMELFRFSSAGVNLFTEDFGVPSYFSVDGGVTKLADYGQNSDPSDFANSNYGTPLSTLTPEDPFNQYYDSGTLQHLTQADATQLNVLGFDTFDTIDTTPPTLVHDSSVSVAAGRTVVISSSELEFDDNVSTHAQETYTIVAAPADGTLLKSGVATTTFTQADIDNGLISYRETGNFVASDSFTFTVADAAGNATATQKLQVAITLQSAQLYDFNGDGEADILWTTTDDAVNLWLSNKSGGFTHVAAGPAPTSSKIVGVGDFNGDGKADVVWKDTANGALTEWLSDGSGGFTHVGIGVIAAGSRVVGVADFNGDGAADILWRDATGALTLWDSNGTGGFTHASAGTAPASLQVAGVADFNGDGDADILFRSTSGAVKLWESNGSGGLTHENLGTLSTSWAIAGSGDFNDDGDADILFRNTNGAVKLWESNGSGGFTHDSLGTLSTSWQVAAVGDFNGDGKADILWKNTNGAMTLWDSNASGGFTQVSLGVVSTGWTIQGG